MTDFVIADLHLGDKATAARRRALLPDCMNHDAELVRRWNLVVGESDTVYVLGDAGGARAVNTLRSLHGRKHLVAGNCDDLVALHRSNVFASIRVATRLPGALLTHIPVHPSELGRSVLNVHGHLHAQEISDPRYFCASVERTAFAPIPLAYLMMEKRPRSF